MKIGVVTHYMPPHFGGIERVAETLFTAYAQTGIDVGWVASRAPATAPAREGQRIRVPCLNVVERLTGVPVPVWGVRAWRELKALVRWADALHVHDCLYMGSAMAVALAQRRGIPVLLSQHVGFIRYRLPLLNFIERVAFRTLGRAVLRRAACIVFATPAAEAFIPKLLGRRPPNSLSIANGIDTELFHPARPGERRAARVRLGLPGDRAVVLFAGRLVEKKGIPLVAEASRRMPSTHFLVVGDGPLAGVLAAAGGNVTRRRFVEASEMPGCYQAADCLLLPSHGEGLPLVVQEAMACGLPVIVSEDEGYAEPLIRAGVAAGASRTPEALVARLVEVLAGARSLGGRAREHAETEWSAAMMAARYLALLEELVAPGMTGGRT
jgi:glycosyltransferase involved in cell wall biosynthesis